MNTPTTFSAWKRIVLHPFSWMAALLVTGSVLFAATHAPLSGPTVLQHVIPAPPVGVQSGPQLGYTVAVDGAYTVVGAPFDDLQGTDSGTVKIFNSTTGDLLFVLANPNPRAGAKFGNAVAISGTRVAVGAFTDTVATSLADGRAYVYDLSSATPTVPVLTLNNPTPLREDQFGISVGISGTLVVVGTYGDDDSGAVDAGSAYVYDLNSATPGVPVFTLNNPTPALSDLFGYSVAISGMRVVVGAFQDDTGAADAGSAYVYDLSGATPTVPVATLNNPSPAATDDFGRAVAISGTRVVVGAHLNDTGANADGSAYVYDLTSATPTVPVLTLNNPSPFGEDQFGNAVGISGTKVVIGTYGDDDSGAVDAGSAYVYDLTSATPDVPVTTLNNPTPAEGDLFGYAVAISGTEVAVGAPKDDTRATDAGSAYLYDLSSATPPTPVATLDAPSPSLDDRFGSAIAISGSLVVIGAPQEGTGAFHAGSAYVYDLSSATPTVPAFTLNNPNSSFLGGFGNAVAISGTRVVIGEFSGSQTDFADGRAYVYDLSSATPTVPVLTLNNPTPAREDQFGISVGISGTLIVVGTYGDDDSGAVDAGSAYVYDLTNATPGVPVFTLNNPSPAAGDLFGYSVAISGMRVVVGAFHDDTGATDAGSAYVYDLNSATPTAPIATLNNPSPSNGDQFGNAVAISSTLVVVGAFNDSVDFVADGTAYVYDLSIATPTVPVLTLNNPTPLQEDQFGISVGISGTTVAVGTYGDDDSGAVDAGSAYLYDLTSATPTTPSATLNNPNPAQSDLFGFAVAISGAEIAVGAPQDDTVTRDKGSAFIFGPNDAPVLDASKSPTLDNENQNAGPPAGAVGTLISSLVDFAMPPGQVDNVTDPESVALLGIAVTAAETTNGTWFYSIDNGANWNPLGAVSDSNARLLSADANTRLYFQPAANFNGMIPGAITFRAWDRTSGTNGSLANTSPNGGSAAFSSDTDIASLTIHASNDCTVCHKHTITLTLPCNSLELLRHRGHGDTEGPCPLQPGKVTRTLIRTSSASSTTVLIMGCFSIRESGRENTQAGRESDYRSLAKSGRSAIPLDVGSIGPRARIGKCGSAAKSALRPGASRRLLL